MLHCVCADFFGGKKSHLIEDKIIFFSSLSYLSKWQTNNDYIPIFKRQQHSMDLFLIIQLRVSRFSKGSLFIFLFIIFKGTLWSSHCKQTWFYLHSIFLAKVPSAYLLGWTNTTLDVFSVSFSVCFFFTCFGYMLAVFSNFSIGKILLQQLPPLAVSMHYCLLHLVKMCTVSLVLLPPQTTQGLANQNIALKQLLWSKT